MTYRVRYLRPAGSPPDPSDPEVVEIDAETIGEALEKGRYLSPHQILSIVRSDTWGRPADAPPIARQG